MANEDGNDDRLTKNEFAELIQHLSVQEILTIEYRIQTVWSKLFSRKNVWGMFSCNLCVLDTSSFKSLLEHVSGRKHSQQMEKVKQLYHPDYTYPKNDKKEDSEQSQTKNIECDSVTLDQPTVIDNNENKTHSEEEKIALTINLESSTIPEKSDANITHVDEIVEENASSEIEKEASINSEEKILEIVKQENNIPKAFEVTVNCKPTLKEEIKITKKFAGKRLSEDSYGEENSDTKKPKIVINPAAAFSLKQSSTKAKEEKNENLKVKPQYQTDKIIVPTIHKNKSNNDKTLSPSSLTPKSQSNDQPQFSLKSYSSKPSDNDVHGILGVEYVIKILKHRNDNSPRFECGLCELVLDGFAMQRHLEGYNHRLKFCEKHFPTAIRHYRQYMQNVPEPEIFKVMAAVLAKLAVAIEQHHGRNLPYECYERDFSLNRHEILAKAFSCRHASEQFGPTFTHVVGSKEIDEFINNRHKYMPPPFSRSAIFDMKPGSSSKSYDRHQNSKNVDKESSSRDRHRNAGRENAVWQGASFKSYMSSDLNEDLYHSSNSYNQIDKTNVHQVDDKTYNLMVDDFLKGTLKGLSGNDKLRDNRKRTSPSCSSSSGKRKSLSPLRQNDIWQAYRHMVDQELNNLEERFKQYRKDPETHPSYNDEWQKFWKRRKDELVSAGLDHRKYNYQPEWVRFVKIRIEELYGQEVENLKIKCRDRLCLPMVNDNVSDVRYHVQAPKVNSSNQTQTTVTNTEVPISLPNTSTLLHCYNDTTPQVVSVLRLMTALEDSLGSLGPKIIDLLSKALQAEKTSPSHVNAIILTDENCSLIETAKEKFKGLVITGLFEGSKKKVLNQVINDAEALLKYAYHFKQLLSTQRLSVQSSLNRTQNKSSFSHEPQSSNYSDTFKNQQNQRKIQPSSSTDLLTRVNKKELASKLAATLVAQGKTDFDPQQLQQLVAVYKLIEKKKRENAGLVSSNKEGSSLLDQSSSKKTLSDTLSDLLKPTSSAFTTTNVSNTLQSAQGISSQILGSKQVSSNNFSNFATQGNCIQSSSFTSVSQNYSDNYINNTAQSIANAPSAGGGGGNQIKHRIDCDMNYTNNLPPNNQNFDMTTMYNNQYHNNNRMAQNWGWNSNMEMNQNYNMGGPNNNYNQTTNWHNF